MEEAFITKYYIEKKVSLDAEGKTYHGTVAECNDGVLSLKWDTEDEYTHIEIEKITAIWKRM
ncbi:MM0924 family protein [Methanohalobium sp.]|uniref:MM0924 family protein n=1 Tax=Methanohalobium sp. TaxID=2837493 RepID=UPI0025D45A9A|nr:MM0924 family protein [Methanohalobium sp.]